MTDFYCPWPYAAKPLIQFEWHANTLTLFLIFQYPMDTDVTPPVNLFVVKVDGVNKTPNHVVWGDAHTLRVNLFNLLAHPDRVLCTYNGPDDGLRMSWQKQWEPFDRIVCGDVPFDWEHILDVDVPNARVTINGSLQLENTPVPSGTYNDLDVSGKSLLFLDALHGDITINGFSGGVTNQALWLCIIKHLGNDITLSHINGAGDQKIYLHHGADEILRNNYGGWNLFCYVDKWFDISHAKHV